jgi:2-phosphosulfolactate phosphatase
MIEKCFPVDNLRQENQTMDHVLNVYALPSLVSPEELAGGTVVVIDVLRSTTTIAYALEAGALEVIPCQEVDEARALASQFPPGDVVLGGERKGLRIDGFDLGNSPTEYTPSSVGNRSVVLTTTNGTRAMANCTQAARVLMGAFVNASAIFDQLVGQEQVHLLCSGTDGQYSRDDVLLAGMLVEWLQQRGGMPYQLNAQAVTARENWVSSFAVPYVIGAEPLDAELLARELRKSLGGRNLTAIGLDEDIRTAAQLDRFSVVPELDLESFRIRLCHN